MRALRCLGIGWTSSGWADGGRALAAARLGIHRTLQQQGEEYGGHAAHADGKAAHGALHLPNLQRLGGANGMAAGADSQAGRHRILLGDELIPELK